MLMTGGYCGSHRRERVNQTCLSARKVKPTEGYFTRLLAIIYIPGDGGDRHATSPMLLSQVPTGTFHPCHVSLALRNQDGGLSNSPINSNDHMLD